MFAAQRVILRPYYQQADFVQDSVRSIQDVLWITLVLVFSSLFFSAISQEQPGIAADYSPYLEFDPDRAVCSWL